MSNKDGNGNTIIPDPSSGANSGANSGAPPVDIDQDAFKYKCEPVDQAKMIEAIKKLASTDNQLGGKKSKNKKSRKNRKSKKSNMKRRKNTKKHYKKK